MTSESTRIGGGSRTAWIVVGSVMALGSLWWGSFNVLGLLAHEVRTTVETIDAAGLAVIEVDNDAGGIRIEAAETESVTITARLSEGLLDPDSDHRIEGDRLILDGDCSGPPIGDMWCSISYVIEIPARLAVVASASDGRVTIIGAAGAVDARSSHGSVVLEQLSSDVVVARSSNGRVLVGLATSPRSVDASSSNGSVTVELPDEAGVAFAVDADTGNGRRTVEVRTDPGSDRTLRINSDNGNVTARYRP